MVTDRITSIRYEWAHRAVGLLLLALVMQSALAATAGAHASFIDSSPVDGAHLETPPDSVVLEFSETVTIVEGGFTLHTTGSEPIPLQPSATNATLDVPMPEGLADGSYVLQWRVISADSHPIAGTVRFSIGSAQTVPGPESVDSGPTWLPWMSKAATGMAYLGVLGALGVLLVGWQIARTDLDQIGSVSQRLAIIGLVGLALSLPLVAIERQGNLPHNLDGLVSAIGELDTNTTLASILGLMLISATIGLSRHLHGTTARFWLATGLTASAALAFILSGHTRTREPVWLMMAADAVHIWAGGVWLGGIIVLGIGLSGRWQGDAFATPEHAVRAVASFSKVAGVVACAVAISGTAMAVAVLRTPSALIDTAHGRTLIVKVGLVGIILMLAAINRYRLLPRMLRGDTGGLLRVQRLVLMELALLVVVTGVTAYMVQQNPNLVIVSADTVLLEETVRVDADHEMHASIIEQHDGTLAIELRPVGKDAQWGPPTGEAEAAWFLESESLGPINQALEFDPASGAYRGLIQLPQAGEWKLEIRVPLDRFTDSRVTVTVTVPD